MFVCPCAASAALAVIARLPNGDTWATAWTPASSDRIMAQRLQRFSVVLPAQHGTRLDAERAAVAVMNFGPIGLHSKDAAKGQPTKARRMEVSIASDSGHPVTLSVFAPFLMHVGVFKGQPTKPDDPVGKVDVAYLQLARDAGELLFWRCFDDAPLSVARKLPQIHVMSAVLLERVGLLSAPSLPGLLALFVWAAGHCAHAGMDRAKPRIHLPWHTAYARAVTQAWELLLCCEQHSWGGVVDGDRSMFLSVLAALPQALLLAAGEAFMPSMWDDRVLAARRRKGSQAMDPRVRSADCMHRLIQLL